MCGKYLYETGRNLETHEITMKQKLFLSPKEVTYYV